MCSYGRINGEKRAGRREGTEAREATDHVVFPVILCPHHRLPVPHPETDGKDEMIEAEQRASGLPIRRKACARQQRVTRSPSSTSSFSCTSSRTSRISIPKHHIQILMTRNKTHVAGPSGQEINERTSRWKSTHNERDALLLVGHGQVHHRLEHLDPRVRVDVDRHVVWSTVLLEK